MSPLLSSAAVTVPRDSASGILIVDKPAGWTSHDVVARVRSLLNTRKVGHTGTLDPLGTGVLPVCVGDATKLAGYAQMADKVYRVTVRLGVSTDTQDSTGRVIRETPLPDNGPAWESRILEQLERSVGEFMQTPPMYAAVKMGGEPLYKKARRGEVVEREPRRITIYAITDPVIALPDVSFTLSCSKGTYARTVGSDLGDALGVGGHLVALRRLVCGPIGIDEAVTLKALEAAAQEGTLAEVLHPDDHLLNDMPVLWVGEATAQRMLNGIAPHGSEWFSDPEGRSGLPRDVFSPGTLCRAYGIRRGFFALAEATPDPVRPIRVRRIVKMVH